MRIILCTKLLYVYYQKSRLLPQTICTIHLASQNFENTYELNNFGNFLFSPPKWYLIIIFIMGFKISEMIYLL